MCVFIPSYQQLSFPSLQLVLFGLSNQMVVTFKEENTASFKHLFLKDYVDGADDTLAVYTQSDVYEQIYYAIEQVKGTDKYTLCRKRDLCISTRQVRN